ncbi:uncharacterized protein ELE39_003283 [Cryptosporidium sp. chipmunk genotype I]|uniref:uncharacterized protein n=1 Tax=Cryptosporidium sp. chipmunk genotype I TaxID=1280935 RepID=UPI00351A6CB5|nr:hypothetical protein ELE39_003283 [Cryptosporidium sp. chipmunk genotype I]
MSLKFSTCYYLFFIIITNILILSRGEAVHDGREALLQETGIYTGHESQIKAQDTFDPSGLLSQITSSGLLSSRYETNYFMESIIKFLVRYLSLIVNFSAIFGDRNYKSIYNKISNVASYLESRSSYSNRNKMLFHNRVNELSEYINLAVNIKLFSLLFTDSSNISKEVICIIADASKKVMHTISKIVTLLEKLSSFEVDSNLRYTSKFLSKVSNDCIRMFSNCIRKYSKMSKSQFNSLFASKIEQISKSTLSVELSNEFGYLPDMEANFEKIAKSIEAYNQFLETGNPSLTDVEIEEAKSIIANFFENGGLDETSIFKKEEIVMISFEFLGLAAMNLYLFDKEKFYPFKNEVEEAWKSATSMINYRGTEIRLSQTIVFTIREEIRTLMRYQEFLRLDFAVMNLDDSLLKDEILHFITCFYESLLRTSEFVRKEQSRDIGGKYISTIYSKLNPLFEKALDYYKNTILDLEQVNSKSRKTIGGTISKVSRKSTNRALSKKSLKLNNRYFSKIKSDSTRKTRKIITAKKKNLSRLERTVVDKRGNEGENKNQFKKKSERRLKARILSETSQLLRVSKMMRAQLCYLNKINQFETAAIIESVLEISNEILISDGLISKEDLRESISGSVDFSTIIYSLRSIGDQTNSEGSLFTENFSKGIDSENKLTRKKTKTLEQYSDQSSLVVSEQKSKLEDAVSLKPRKSVNSTKSRRRAEEKVRPLDQIGPTIELFGENAVFATRKDSKLLNSSDGDSKMAYKSKNIPKARSKHTRARINSSNVNINNFSKVNSNKITKAASSNNSNKSYRNISRRPMTRKMSKNQCFTINKKLIEERTLFMVPPTLFGQETVQNMISRYNIKILNFSHVSASSPSDYIIQAIKFCYNEIGHLFFEIFPFLSGIENMILKQIIMQMIILFKNLVSVLIAKDRKRSELSKRTTK